MSPAPRLLIVDDDDLDAELAAEALKAAGVAAPDRASNGEQALARMRARRYDLVLLDLQMPRMGGHEVIEAVRGDPATRLTPLVVLSTSSAQADVNRAYDAGANAYLVKPAELDGYVRAAEAVAAFWMKTAKLPEPSGR